MNSRKITALLLSSAMALSVLTGCGGVNKDKTVATLNGEPVKLGVANFAARFGQAGADDFYTAYFGKNVWTSDLYGNGTTGQDNFKDSVMDSLEDMYVLQLHMDEYNVSITDDEKQRSPQQQHSLWKITAKMQSMHLVRRRRSWRNTLH